LVLAKCWQYRKYPKHGLSWTCPSLFTILPKFLYQYQLHKTKFEGPSISSSILYVLGMCRTCVITYIQMFCIYIYVYTHTVFTCIDWSEN
jgi:hypothetical protein